MNGLKLAALVLALPLGLLCAGCPGAPARERRIYGNEEGYDGYYRDDTSQPGGAAGDDNRPRTTGQGADTRPNDGLRTPGHDTPWGAGPSGSGPTDMGGPAGAGGPTGGGTPGAGAPR